MIVGVLREIKDNENRVAITPKGVKAFLEKGHQVLVEKNAGIGSGITNKAYEEAGAKIVDAPKEICEKAKLILKIKEPIKNEPGYFNESHILFTYFHFASSKELTDAMLESGAACIAYETVETDDRKLPLLAPMSEVAGKMASQTGAYYLGKKNGGKGILLSGVTGVEPANVVVIGGGFVGTNATVIAARMGANVTVLELSDKRIEELKKTMPSNVKVVKSTPQSIAENVKKADLLVGAVLVPGAKAPRVVSRELVESMEPGSVIVDVAIDQGGCIETSKPTSHSDPIYDVNGVIHYCVTNMPGQFPRTSSYALTNATLEYALELADNGLAALKKNEALKKGLNMFKGKITNKGVADAFGMKYTEPESVL